MALYNIVLRSESQPTALWTEPDKIWNETQEVWRRQQSRFRECYAKIREDIIQFCSVLKALDIRNILFPISRYMTNYILEAIMWHL